MNNAEPARAAAPPFQLYLPYPVGNATVYGGAPHATNFSAVDFGPPKLGEMEVRAANSGVLTYEDREGFPRCFAKVQSSDGWAVTYLHLKDAPIRTPGIDGKVRVNAGDIIGFAGQPGSEPGTLPRETCSTGSKDFRHVHMALLYNNTPQSLDGVDIGGYVVHSTGDAYCGYWTLNGSELPGRACVANTVLKNNRITPGGLLRVTTSPPVPSQISVDGVPADSWGLSWVKLPPGEHTVAFSSVEGYATPAPQTVNVGAGTTSTVVGEFVRRGSLRVVTSPAVASTISVDGVARNAWGMWTDFAPGPHQVCFGAVAGYTAPACQTVNVVAGETSTITGAFIQNAQAPGATGKGLLRVTTSPALPAQITVNGQPADTWGLTWVALPPGTYTIAASHVEGYADASPQNLTVVAGQTTTAVMSFTRRGVLRVTTSPPVASTVSVDGIPRNDYGMWTDLPVGDHQVCFGAAVGYNTTPACRTVTLTAGDLTTTTGNFS